jgi:hypothetical protein
MAAQGAHLKQIIAFNQIDIEDPPGNIAKLTAPRPTDFCGFFSLNIMLINRTKLRMG